MSKYLDETGTKKLVDSFNAKIPGVATVDTVGLVKPDDSTIKITEEGIISAKPDLSTYALKSEIPGVATEDMAGLVKPDGTTITVGVDGTITATVDTSTLATKAELGQYAKTEDVATKAELADYAKSSQVATDIQSAKTELEGEINSKIGSAYKAKGDSAFADLPTPSADTVGDVYNVTDAFVTDDKFATQSESYPAGTNVVVVDAGEETYKYDALSGVVDLSEYAKTSALDAYLKAADMTAITTEEIEAMFN